ncbi:MAG TPA: cytochrome c oxidase subunit II [Gemmatimonadaceae bacterium]
MGQMGQGHPASTLAMHGVTGASQARLGWYLLVVSLVVVVVVCLLLGASAWRARRRRAAAEERELVHPGGSGLAWVMVGGIIVPAIVLTATFVFTVATLHANAAPWRPPAATIRVVGHQWWWEVHYVGGSPAAEVVTANEIHVPVGEPVRLVLSSDDVIHSFWVPEIAGKMDLIPGKTNETWIAARDTGAYEGECGEYCGVQHSHMHLRLIAEPPDRFAAWLAAQRRPAATGTAPSAGAQAFFSAGCASCHTIRGTRAGGRVGPDLTHLMSRRTIAGGTLENTRGNLAAWVTDAQGLKPGARMPTLAVQPDQFQQLLGYLETLR